MSNQLTPSDALSRNVSRADGERNECHLIRDPVEFAGSIRVTKDAIQSIYPEINSDELKKHTSSAINHLNFLDKVFAAGINFGEGDVSSVEMIIQEIVCILDEFSDEISELELKQKAGGDLADDTVH